MGSTTWDSCSAPYRVPDWIRRWIAPDAVGAVTRITRSGAHSAALAAVRYDGNTAPSGWLVMLRTSLPRDGLPLDLRSYAAGNPVFPNDPTSNQSFGEDQWESYRLLGELLAQQLFRE